MDNYLESLVLKGEKPEEIVTDTEEVVAEPEVEEAQLEAAESEEIVAAEPAPEVEATEESAVEAEPEEAAPEVKAAKEVKPATVTIKAEDTNNGIVNHPDVPIPIPEEPTAVMNIRIYNTPDPKGPFKFFSGNVMVRNKVDTMMMVEYMKPGFGLVKGFTPDLK